MATYWAIATSHKYPDIPVKKIEAENDLDAALQAQKWHREDVGFRYDFVVAKEIYPVKQSCRKK